MLKNYFITALRNIIKHKGHAFINISGLSIGIACCLLLFLWIQDELSYDRYHENADHIYRVVQKWEADGKVGLTANTPAPLGPALIDEFAGIRKFVRFANSEFEVINKDRRFREKIFFADPDIFKVFTLPLIMGNPEYALKDKHSILISESMRKKYFPEENPLGKTLSLGSKIGFKITGVFKDIPHNSHLRFDFLASFLIYRPDYWTQWGVSNFLTYLLVSDEFSREDYNRRMPQFVEKHRGKKAREEYKIAYPLQPLTSIHLHSHLRNEISPNRDIGTVYIFSFIAFFILLIACLNYINLSSVRLSMRMREIGLRKILGAGSSQLFKQFLGESTLLAVMALPISLLLTYAFLPVFNELSGKTLSFDYLNDPYLFGAALGIILLVGFISGFVPALLISAVRPMNALRGVLKQNLISSVLRKSLVVFQFTISILFIVCSFIMSNQIQYMRNKDLGLERKNMINVHLQNNEQALQKYEALKQEFSRHPDVLSVSASDFFPGNTRWNMNYWHEGMEVNRFPGIRCLPVDFDFFQTFKIKILAGRPFSKDFGNDEEDAFIINETAVKEFGWAPDEAIGKKFKIGGGREAGLIIGVAQDFNFNSLHKEVHPLTIYIYPKGFEFIYVRYKPGKAGQVLEFLEKKWQEFIPEQTFMYSFLDEDFDGLYKTEFRLYKIFLISSVLAVFIACLGLFGLAAFISEQRTKEIGIRKVIGASVSRIVLLLSKEFSRWILIANLLAWPIAWYAMHRWLNNFAFRAHIPLWAFLSAGFIVLFIAMLALSYKAIKAARTNPVEALRYE